MVNPTYEKLGSAPSMIRELFAYGLRRSAEVGPENVFDYSLGNPSIPVPQPVQPCWMCCTTPIPFRSTATPWPAASTAPAGPWRRI